MEMTRPNRLRVGAFELDLKAGELCGNGKVRRLQEQPFQILRLLVERSGDLVTRQEIQKKLWPNDTVVEFDHSIHTAIKKLRNAFGDSGDDPKYIETVARRGYRLMVPVERVDATPVSSPVAAVAPATEEASDSQLLGKKVSHYRVLEVIGGGGMGVVYRAEDLKLGRPVALKFLPEEVGRNPKALERFEREARAASALDHPNICTIYEFGEQEGRQFIAMALLEGRTLRDLIAEKAGPLPIPELVSFAIQIADGLAAAHAKSIIHRDIKPANIFITQRGEAKIIDFGLAKVTDTASREDLHPEETQTTSARNPGHSLAGVAAGTVPYMSPEQVRGEKLDARTDLFSLGLVIYETATGEQAFSGDTSADLRDAILHREPVPPRVRNPAVPPKLDEIIGKALEKDRNQRTQTAAELRTELQQLKTDAETSTSAAMVTASSARKRNLWLYAAIFILLFAAIASALYTRYLAKPAPFQQIEMRQLTTIGKVKMAATSPDGKYVAYVVDELGNGSYHWVPTQRTKESLWVRQVAGGDVQAVPAAEVGYRGLTFSRDGDYLYVVRSEGVNSALGYLYKIPVLGGSPKKLIADVDGKATLSPDGKEIAFLRYGYDGGLLVVANEDGSGEREPLGERKSKFMLIGTAAWSPSGRTIASTAFLSESSTGRTYPVEFAVQGGAERSLTNKRWAWIGDLAWLSDGRGVILNAMEPTSTLPQIGYISYANGEARRITTDTNQYEGVSLTADSHTLATVQQKSSFDPWVAPLANAGGAKPIASGGSSRHPTWSRNGKIVLARSEGQGELNIWTMEQDGSNATQLTANVGRINMAPRVSPDGHYIVFVSERTGTAHIWRMDIDGNNLKQLTNSPADFLWYGSPDCTPDGKWVLYTKNGADLGIWKVPIEGGDPVRLTSKSGFYPSVSPDGKMLAYYFVGPGKSGVEVLPLDGNAPPKWFDIAAGTVRWVPDSRSFLYVRFEGGVSNVWSQPVSGAPPKQETHFNSELIQSFDISRDGKQLVMNRGTANRDVVLIRDVK